MSDWGMYELDDIVWDELGQSDDHIVPHPGVKPANESIAQVEFQTKRRCRSASVIGSTDNKSSVVENVVQRNGSGIIHPIITGMTPMLDKGLWSHGHDDVFPASCDDAYATSEDAKASNNCFNGGNEESVGNGFCTDDSLLENQADRVESNLCHFPLDDISTEDNNFKFFRNESDHKETNDLMDYGWPDIGNFEDVDRMFRNSDSTFGQGSASNAIDISWFSASDVIDGSEDAIKSGFGSSSSGSTPLQNLSKHQEAGGKLMCVGDSQPAVHNDENCSTFQVVNMQGRHMKNIDRSGGKRKDQSLECINGTVNGIINEMKISERLEPPHSEASVPKGSPEIHSQQKQPWTADSVNYIHSYIPHVKPEYNLPPNHCAGTPAVSCIESKTQNYPPVSRIASCLVANSNQPVRSFDPQSKFLATTAEEKLKKSRRRKQIRSTLTNEDQHEHTICQNVFSDQASGQLQLPNDTGGDSVVEETGTGLPTVEIDSSSVQRGSCLGSVLYDEGSLEASSFYQLQDVLEQLDVRTKLCIRDSLYRLARSAEHRHSFGAANDASRDDRVRGGASTTDESNKCARCLDAETNTNPIDRSIAHLLFYRPSGSSGRLVTDAVSLESHIAVNSTSQQTLLDHPVSEKDVSLDTDSELMVTNK